MSWSDLWIDNNGHVHDVHKTHDQTTCATTTEAPITTTTTTTEVSYR